MLTAVVATLALQAAGMISWNPAPADAPLQAPAPAATAAATLPDWAREDPFAWEWSQCSPMIRKDASMEACQVRVRTELAAVLGDRLPNRLSPDGIEGCRQVSNGSGGYELTCAPVQRTLNSTPAPVAEVCEERPTRTANGVVAFGRECRPATGAPTRGGLTFRTGGD